MKIPGIYSMDLTLAGRHEHYEGVSQDANVPKVTFRYQPVQDLTVRASFANSFVAPNLYQLYGPVFDGLFESRFAASGSQWPRHGAAAGEPAEWIQPHFDAVDRAELRCRLGLQSEMGARADGLGGLF